MTDVQLDSYENEREDDCVEAALGNAVNIITGRFTPDAAVQSLYKPKSLAGKWWWSRIVAGWTGLRMWEFYFTGLNGYRPKSFGKIAPNAKDIRAALDKYRAIIIGEHAGHQVCLYSVGLQVFIADSVNGILPVSSLGDLVSTMDGSNFAFSDKRDFGLILGGMKNGWATWSGIAFLLALIGYTAWRVM